MENQQNNYGHHSGDENVHGPDFGNENQHTEPGGRTEYIQVPRRKSKGGVFWKIFTGIILAISIIGNIFLLLMLIAVITVFATGSVKSRLYVENVVKSGDTENKVAVINIEGVIENELAREFRRMIKTAGKDDNVKAVIVRTLSPGGGVGASDRIHREIMKFREENKKPVVAFMQTVAASGGYYTSVACDKIVAEPTVITGSIGVVVNHIVAKQLLEEKLGIDSMMIRSGPKKAWPSTFDEPTEEQRIYLQEKLIEPAYDRFVNLVNDGRSELTLEQVKDLADGSIYIGPEALEKKLVDQIGYIDDAITVAESLAEISDAHVVEYSKPFSFGDFMSTKGKLINIDENLLQKMKCPQVLYLWDGWK